MVLPIFDKNIKTLHDFDPELAEYLKSIEGKENLRKILHSDIDGTAGKTLIADMHGIELVEGFLQICDEWVRQKGVVHWMAARGVTKGTGSLRHLSKHRQNINFTGCDGNEAFIDGYLKQFLPVYDISEYTAWFDTLRQEYSGHPVEVSVMGYSVLGVFIEEKHPGYGQFKSKMDEIAQDLKQKRSHEYQTNCRPPGILLQPAKTIGKREAVLRIGKLNKQEIGFEIYGGDDDSDVEAQREVNAKPYGFAYKIFSRREDLDTAFAWEPIKLDYLSGLVDGPEQWARLLAMIIAAL